MNALIHPCLGPPGSSLWKMFPSTTTLGIVVPQNLWLCCLMSSWC